jgi:hypothetical protein
MAVEATQAKEPLALVRIQDGLHGLRIEDGATVLPYERESERNTLHFSLNGAVEDHAYGKFNENADGSLRGRVAIVAPIEAAPFPAGLGQADTWFRLSAEPGAKGFAGRSLRLSQATIVAPEGMELPEGAKALRYDEAGGKAARDAAVAAALRELGVEPKSVGFRSWAGFGESEAIAWARGAAEALWGERARAIETGGHMGSLDEELESMDNRGLLKSLGNERFGQGRGGEDVTIASLVAERAARGEALAERLYGLMGPQERARVGAHYEAQIGRLRRSVAEADALDAQWAERARAEFLASQPAMAPAAFGSGPGVGLGWPASGGALPPPLPPAPLGVLPSGSGSPSWPGLMPPPLPLALGGMDALPPPLPLPSAQVGAQKLAAWRAARSPSAASPQTASPRVAAGSGTPKL